MFSGAAPTSSAGQALDLVRDLGGAPADAELIEPVTQGLAILGLNDIQATQGQDEPDSCGKRRLLLR
jgi:hypothetical protein